MTASMLTSLVQPTLSGPSAIQWVLELIQTHRTVAIAYILGVVTFPAIKGLVSRLPTKVIMRALERRQEAADARQNWLDAVHNHAEQAIHHLDQQSIQEDGTLPPAAANHINRLLELQAGPDHAASEAPDNVIDALATLRNSRSQLGDAPSSKRATEQLDARLQTVKTRAEEAR